MLIRVCIVIIIVSILAFAGFIIYDKFIKNRFPSHDLIHDIDITADYSVMQDTIDDIPVHKLKIETDTGERVFVLGQTVEVKDGVAEVIIEDSKLLSLEGEELEGGGVKVSLEVVISADGAKDRKDRVSFDVSLRPAPLKMIHPKTEEYVTDSDSLTISMEVLPKSNITINGDNFSDLVTQDGKFEKSFDLIERPEREFEIVVSTDKFSDRIHRIKVVKDDNDSNNILKIHEKQPIKTSEQWVKITGITEPNAELKVSGAELNPDFTIDENGNFTIYVKTANIGYTLCTLAASVDDGRSSSMDIALERPTTEAEYTSRAWEFTYDEIVDDPQLHNGQIFLLNGSVKEIVSLDDKQVFILDVSQDDSTEKLVYVEYWGNTNIKEGQNLRIFGNRWGNKDDIPRILTQFVYIAS